MASLLKRKLNKHRVYTTFARPIAYRQEDVPVLPDEDTVDSDLDSKGEAARDRDVVITALVMVEVEVTRRLAGVTVSKENHDVPFAVIRVISDESPLANTANLYGLKKGSYMRSALGHTGGFVLLDPFTNEVRAHIETAIGHPLTNKEWSDLGASFEAEFCRVSRFLYMDTTAFSGQEVLDKWTEAERTLMDPRYEISRTPEILDLPPESWSNLVSIALEYTLSNGTYRDKYEQAVAQARQERYEAEAKAEEAKTSVLSLADCLEECPQVHFTIESPEESFETLNLQLGAMQDMLRRMCTELGMDIDLPVCPPTVDPGLVEFCKAVYLLRPSEWEVDDIQTLFASELANMIVCGAIPITLRGKSIHELTEEDRVDILQELLKSVED